MPEVDIQRVFSDPVFRQLPGPEKIAALDELDPGFKSLPGIKDKMDFIQALLPKFPMARKDQGLWATLGQDIKSGAQFALRLDNPVTGPEAAMDLVRSQGEQFTKGAQAARGGSPYEAAAYYAAGLLLGAGPAAAQIGEDIGEGRPGEAAAHSLELAAPFAGGELLKPAGRLEAEPPPLPDAASVLSELKVSPLAKMLARHIPFGVGKFVGTGIDIVEAMQKAGIDKIDDIPKMTRDDLANLRFKEREGRPPVTGEDRIKAIKDLRDELKAQKEPPAKKVPVPKLRGSSLQWMGTLDKEAAERAAAKVANKAEELRKKAPAPKPSQSPAMRKLAHPEEFEEPKTKAAPPPPSQSPALRKFSHPEEFEPPKPKVPVPPPRGSSIQWMGKDAEGAEEEAERTGAAPGAPGAPAPATYTTGHTHTGQPLSPFTSREIRSGPTHDAYALTKNKAMSERFVRLKLKPEQIDPASPTKIPDSEFIQHVKEESARRKANGQTGFDISNTGKPGRRTVDEFRRQVFWEMTGVKGVPGEH